MKTRAAILERVGGRFEIEELDLAPPAPNEVLVRVAAAGVCHSDWHLATGATAHPLPVVPGHEGAGVVVEVGKAVTAVKPGDRVALNWAPNCGSCFYCLHDRPSLCGTYVEPLWAGTMMDGTPRLSRRGAPVYHFSGLACFADYTVVPEACCVPIGDGVPAPVAALIGCAVTTGVGAVFQTARVEPGSSVAVCGVGGVGVSILMGAKVAGASTLIAVDRCAEKEKLAREFGATDFVLAEDSKDTPARVRALTEGRGADYVFEAVGVPAVQEACLDAVRPGGSLVLVGLAPVSSSTSFSSAVIARTEKSIVGCYYGTANTARDFPRYADLYRCGQLPIDRLITRRYPLTDIQAAYDAMLAGELARGVIEFGLDGDVGW